MNKPRGFFADQFEVITTAIHPFPSISKTEIQNKSNHDAHYDGTGPEIWRQTNGRLNAFVSGAGWLRIRTYLHAWLTILQVPVEPSLEQEDSSNQWMRM